MSELKGLEGLGFKVHENMGDTIETQEQETQTTQEEGKVVATQETAQPVENKTPEPSAEDSSLKQKETIEDDGDFGEIVSSESEPAVSASETETATQTFDPVAWYNEKFETSYKNEDELMSAAKQKETSQSNVPEDVQALIDFRNETGRSILDYVQSQLADYNLVPDSELVLQDFMNEGMSRQEAQILLEDEFSKVEITDYMEDDEKARAERKNQTIDLKLKRKADSLRKDLNSLKEKYKTPIDGYAKSSETQKTETLSTEDIKRWESTMDASLKSLENYKVDLGDGNAFNYSAKQFIESNAKTLKNPETALQSFINEEGWDSNAIARAVFLDKNFDKIVKSIYKNAIGQGAKKVVEKSKNSNFNVEGSGKQSQSFKSESGEEKTFEFLKSRLDNGGMRFRF